MDLHISGEDGTRTIEDVEYFEVGSDHVYVERYGESETFEGEVYGGDA